MLTKKEKETYDFIIDFQRKYGQFPLLTEIADGIGITSKGVVHRYVKSLADQDKIQKIRYKHRGYMLKKIGSDISFSIKKLGKISAGGPIEAIPDKEILELNHIFSNENNLPLQIFRLSGIYSLQNNILHRLISGQAKIVKKENHFFSRVHVEDIANLLFRSMKSHTLSQLHYYSGERPHIYIYIYMCETII